MRRNHAALQMEFDEYQRRRAHLSAAWRSADATKQTRAGEVHAAGAHAAGLHDAGVCDAARVSATKAATQAAEAWIAEAEAEAAQVVASRGASRARPSESVAVVNGTSDNSRVSYGSRDSRGCDGAPCSNLTRVELQSELARAKPSALGVAPVLTLRSWALPSSECARTLTLRHVACRATLAEPSLVLRLFYGALLPELHARLQSGFHGEPPADPLGLRDYGRGWYFSKFAHHAHQYTGGSGCVMLVDVAVGNTETVVRCDTTRVAPSAGYDSIVVPGRRLPSQERGTRGVSEEYVIFEGAQVLPLALLFYEAEDEGRVSAET